MYGRAEQDSGLWGSFVSVLSLLLSDNGDVIPSRAADVVSRAVFHDTISDTSQLRRPLRRSRSPSRRRGVGARTALLTDAALALASAIRSSFCLLYLCKCVHDKKSVDQYLSFGFILGALEHLYVYFKKKNHLLYFLFLFLFFCLFLFSFYLILNCVVSNYLSN